MIKQAKKLSPKEYAALYFSLLQTIKNYENSVTIRENALDTLFTHLSPYLHHLAHKAIRIHKLRPSLLEDMYQSMAIHVMKAVHNFDVTKYSNFLAYIIGYTKDAVRHIIITSRKVTTPKYYTDYIKRRTKLLSPTHHQKEIARYVAKKEELDLVVVSSLSDVDLSRNEFSSPESPETKCIRKHNMAFLLDTIKTYSKLHQNIIRWLFNLDDGPKITRAELVAKINSRHRKTLDARTLLIESRIVLAKLRVTLTEAGFSYSDFF